ncbi:MAG TPA: aldehyde dehydrogenase family protein [Caulobacteraceae bacterium]|jgi:glutamate-5-semialdehyde dehydrogenase|nr:aldehyde dehydrogenase family protein [Caulobacteraceae bacterium]
MHCALTHLTAGMPVIWGGDRVTLVSEALAQRFAPGDRLLVMQDAGDLLHIPSRAHEIASAAVGRARDAFAAMARVSDQAITDFFERFAANLESSEIWAVIAAANGRDVDAARARGRGVTRLVASETMRRDMVAGLRAWRDAPAGRERLVERVDHDGWSVEQVTAPLGVVGFVFEGRPNVFADAAGVIRGGNTVVFRIGADALETARALAAHALVPALTSAGLPEGAAVLVDSAEHAAGWALFADPRLSLAVARGSGPAVAQLGGVARQAGVPVSLHGTGGAWLAADESADAARFSAAVFHSLDRKVCNTLNVCCIPRARAHDLVPAFLDALRRAGERRGHGAKLHVMEGEEAVLPAEWRDARTRVRRADGDHDEALVETIDEAGLAREWEWEDTPEVTLKLVADLDEAARLFNAYSPRFIACVIAEDEQARERFYASVDAAFVGDGFTRWVDGQYALNRPELGLSNWQAGRLFARAGVLSGDGVYTLRTRMSQIDNDLAR